MSQYVRTETKSFYDLSEAQQAYARDQFDWDENIEDSTFVDDPCDPAECLHLGEFLSIGNNPIWDGTHITSAFSGYFIKFGSDCETCTVAYRHW